MKTIHTDKAPAAVGPYSQAIQAGGMLYLSGQIAIDPAAGKIVAGDIEGQTEQCCRNVEAGEDHLLPGRYQRLCQVQCCL